MQEITQLSIDDVSRAVQRAKNTISAADSCVETMARLIAGRLRKGNVPGYILKQLKKELADYNIHTGSWRSEA